MAITINIYYTGQNGSARRFAGEMVSSGTAAQIRAEAGNLRYDYFFPMDDPETDRKSTRLNSSHPSSSRMPSSA